MNDDVKCDGDVKCDDDVNMWWLRRMQSNQLKYYQDWDVLWLTNIHAIFKSSEKLNDKE